MAHGIGSARKRVERLMAEAGISGLVPRKRGRTTIRVPGVRVADDLVKRHFRRRRSRTCSGSPTSPTCAAGRAGSTWPRCRTPSSATIVGWAMAEHMRAELVVDALQMALARRRARGRADPSLRPGIAIRLPCLRPEGPRRRHRHLEWARGAIALTTPSPSRFFATLKKELVRRRSWPDRRELQSAVFDYIETLLQPREEALHTRLSLKGVDRPGPRGPGRGERKGGGGPGGMRKCRRVRYTTTCDLTGQTARKADGPLS